MPGVGPRGPEIGFDRLCQVQKFDFLPLGTTKNRQNPKKTTKNVKQKNVFSGEGGGLILFAVFFLLKEGPYSGPSLLSPQRGLYGVDRGKCEGILDPLDPRDPRVVPGLRKAFLLLQVEPVDAPFRQFVFFHPLSFVGILGPIIIRHCTVHSYFCT